MPQRERNTGASKSGGSPRRGKRPGTGSSYYLSSPREMAPTARRLLSAARTLFDRFGLDGVSTEAVAAEAGERKSLIHYYFGGKSGLIVSLANWLLYDDLWDLRTRVSQLPAGPERVRGLVENMKRLASNHDAYVGFYEILPHVLKDASMRAQMGDYISDGVMVSARALTFEGNLLPQADIGALASLTMAVTDGYALQLIAGAESADVDRDMRVWQEMLTCFLFSGGTSAGESTSDNGDTRTVREPTTEG